MKLHSEVVGERNERQILILHGLFGSASNWRSIARKLSEEYRVISLDLRNHGNSPWSDSMDYRRMANDVAYFIDTNELNSPIVIGHSMGGKTAMALAQTYTGSLGKLFVVDIAPVSYSHDHQLILAAMLGVNLSGIKSRKEIDSQLASTIDEAPLRQFLMQNLFREGETFKWRINLKAISHNMKHLFNYPLSNTVENEIVFIAGGESEYIVSDYHPKIRNLFPNSTIEHIEGAGHWLHAEKPEELLSVFYKHFT